MEAPKHTLCKEHNFMVSHWDFAFAVQNTLTSLKEEASHNVERESIVDESDKACYVVQDKDSLEVTSDAHVDDCVMIEIRPAQKIQNFRTLRIECASTQFYRYSKQLCGS